MKTGPAVKSSAGRKSLPVAVLLQCIPLLGTSSCFTYAARPNDVVDTVNPLFFFLLFWGLGYAYVRHGNRFAFTFMGGPLFFFVSCGVVSSGAASIDFEHGPTTLTTSQVADVRHAALTEGLLLCGLVLLLAVDAWRLAAAHNARLDQPGESDGGRHPSREDEAAPTKKTSQSKEQYRGPGPP
jgi:hypothetical protein